MKEGAHTWAQQRGGSAREYWDNVPGAQTSAPQLFPQSDGAMCCQPTECEAEKEPKLQQFLCRQPCACATESIPLVKPLRPSSPSSSPSVLLGVLWTTSGHKGILQFIRDIQSCWNLSWRSGIAQSIASYNALHTALLLPTPTHPL